MTLTDTSRAHPIKLAEEILKLVGDAELDTAQTALKITSLLLVHRECGAITFARDTAIDPTS